ncbi:MAG TPA: hypothetical protein VFY10_14835 [Dehalococcoidia bacterium]|nr:hypothetical protein [Dehalococcoidia bacterium]
MKADFCRLASFDRLRMLLRPLRHVRRFTWTLKCLEPPSRYASLGGRRTGLGCCRSGVWKSAGESVPSLAVRVEVDENGSFDDDSQVRLREHRTGSDGVALLQWFEWPRNGPARDFTSTVSVSWEDESAIVYIEDLYE